MSEAEPAGEGLTQAGGRLFTLDYASPEQIAGGTVTTSSDVYSLGVVLYELLAGARPYRLKSSQRHEIEAAIMGATVLPLARADIGAGSVRRLSTGARQLRRQLRGDLATIVHKALRKEPLARYSSADAMGHDIRRFLTGRPITARPATVGYLLRRFVSRNVFAVSVAAVAAVALLFATSVSIWQARIAQAQRNNAVRAAARSQAITAFLDNLIIDAPLHGAQMSSMETLKRSTELARREFASQPDYLAEMLTTLARNYRVLGDAQKSMALLDEARRTVTNADVGLKVMIECRYGLALSRVEGTEAGRKIIDAALAIKDVEPTARAGCYQALAYVAQDINDGPGSLRNARAALDEAHKDPSLLPESELSLMADLAYAYLLEAETDRADALYREVIDRNAKLGFARSPVTLTVRSNWAMVGTLTGEPQKALDQSDYILRVLAEDDPGSPPPPQFLGNRGFALEMAGRYREADQAYRHCEQVASAANNSRWSSYCAVGLASLARTAGDLDLADSILRKLETQGGTAAGTSAERRRKMVVARIAMDRGDFDTARQVFSDLVIPNARAFSAQAGLSEALLKAGEVDHAIEVAREALANSQRLQQSAPYSINTGLAWHTLAQALASQGDTAEAAAAFEAALTQLKNTADASHPAIASATEWLSRNEAHKPVAAK
jgi:tetratricopeptide (TPR) repeat protein